MTTAAFEPPYLGIAAEAIDDGTSRQAVLTAPFENGRRWPNLFVVPAYDEAENLPRLLRDMESRPWLFPHGSRVIIVDDGSTDGTASVVTSYAGPLPVELIKLEANSGPGNAFRVGFASALCPSLDSSPVEALVVTLEADTTSDLDSLPAMIARAEAGAELVLASVHGGGQMLNVSRARKLLSGGAGFVSRKALGLDAATVSSFFRVYRASVLRSAIDLHGDDLIKETGYACKAELLAKLTAMRARIEEVPVDLDGSRRLGQSKMRILPTLVGYLRLIVRQRVSGGPITP